MSTSVTSVTKHFPSAENGFTTTTSGTVSSGATTVGLNSVAGYSNGEVVVFVIDPDNANKQTFTGTIDTSGVQVTDVVWTAGTNVSHSAGATVVDYATATHISMMAKGLLVEHNQDGTHGTITTDTINEQTAAAGVTIDNLNVKDGKLNTNNSVVTANITDAAVTPDKLGTGAASANVATSETTTSTTYTDLSTTTDTVTVTVGANGLALVSVSSYLSNNTANAYAKVAIDVSGATTLAASDAYSLVFQCYGANANGRQAGSWLFTGLTPGSTTFKLKYAVLTGGSGSGTGTFANRRISAVPL